MSASGPTKTSNSGLARFVEAAASGSENSKLPPVDDWNPPFCGNLNMRIARDGTWFYEGTPIGRARLVRLFSRILRHDEDGHYYLVTPVEKVGLEVEDAAFVAVEMKVEGAGEDQVLSFRTNVDDWVSVDGDHGVRFVTQASSGGLKPYILVRGRLEALVVRAVYYDLVALGCDHDIGDETWFGIWSSGVFFKMAKSEQAERVSGSIS